MYRKKIVTALTLLLFLSMIAGIFFCALSMQKGEESRRGTLVRVRISREGNAKKESRHVRTRRIRCGR